MITFLWPLAFLALPAPFLLRRLSRPLPRSADGALRVPFFRSLSGGVGGTGRHGARGWLKLAAMTLIWALLVTALSRPVLVGPQVALPSEGRDIMLAIDLSGSMGREDFALNGRATNRLGVVKEAADDFISRRVGDRIGLVLFSNQAYLQAPLTPDRAVVRQLLDQAEVGLTGTDTAIGDAIAIASKRLADRPEGHRVMILLTDGANTAGVIQPQRAAELARDMGVKIYTIGVGATRMVVNDGFGQQVVNPSADLDEGLLTRIADLTGARYFRATDVAGLAAIYREIDRIEPIAADPQFLRPMVALFYWPLGLALAMSALFAAALLPLRFPTFVRPKESRS